MIGEECEEGELLGRWALGQVMVGDESGDKSDQAESPPPAKANQIFGFKNSSSTISSLDDDSVLNEIYFVNLSKSIKPSLSCVHTFSTLGQCEPCANR